MLFTVEPLCRMPVGKIDEKVVCMSVFLTNNMALYFKCRINPLDPWGSENGPSENLITKPQVIKYRKLYRSEELEGDGRASTTFDFRVYSFQDPKG